MAETIPQSRIQIIQTSDDYKNAIRLAAMPLVNENYIQPDYIQAIFDSLERFGPYIILADDFALPHAQPSELVLETGLSLLVIKEGVDLLGQQIRLMIVLAAKNSTDHMDVLSGLAEFLMEPQNIQDVIHASSIHEIKQILDERWNT